MSFRKKQGSAFTWECPSWELPNFSSLRKNCLTGCGMWLRKERADKACVLSQNTCLKEVLREPRGLEDQWSSRQKIKINSSDLNIGHDEITWIDFDLLARRSLTDWSKIAFIDLDLLRKAFLSDLPSSCWVGLFHLQLKSFEWFSPQCIDKQKLA